LKAKIMDASHLLIILSEQEALRLGLNSISVDIPTTLSKITLAKVFLEGCKYTGFSYSEAENITIRALSIRDGTFVLLFSVHIPNMSRIKSSFQRKKFRIKETTGPYVYQFQNCTDMMDAAERLCMAGITCPKAKLLRFGDKYRIIFHLRWKTSKLAKAILQEYGILKGKGRVAAAAAMEHGILLTEDLFSTVCSTYPCTKH